MCCARSRLALLFLQESSWDPPPDWQGEAGAFPVEPAFSPGTTEATWGGEAQQEQQWYEAYPTVPHDEDTAIAPNGTEEFHNLSGAAAALTEAEGVTAPAYASAAAMNSIHHHMVEPSTGSMGRGNETIGEAASKTCMSFDNGSTGIEILADLTGGGQSDGSGHRSRLEATLSGDLAKCSMEELREMSKVSGDALVLPLRNNDS